MLGFAIAVVTPVAGFLVAGRYLRSIPRWRRFGGWLRLGSALTLLLVIGFFAMFNQDTVSAGHGVAGVASRLLATEVFAWYVSFGWLAFRSARSRQPRG